MTVIMTDNSNGYEISMLKAENGRYIILCEDEYGCFKVMMSTTCSATIDSYYYRLVLRGR